jgi:hypothetical protein
LPASSRTRDVLGPGFEATVTPLTCTSVSVLEPDVAPLLATRHWLATSVPVTRPARALTVATLAVLLTLPLAPVVPVLATDSRPAERTEHAVPTQTDANEFEADPPVDGMGPASGVGPDWTWTAVRRVTSTFSP